MSNSLKYTLELDSTGYREGVEQASLSTKDLKKSTEEYLKDFGPLKKQMNAAKKEAQNLAAQFAMLSEAEKNSEFGKELAENLQMAIEKAAELQDVFADTNDAIRNAASDTAGLDALKEVFEISKDATTAYIGVLGRLTNSEKELKNVVSSLAAVQGTFNAVIKTTNALQKNSATMIALQRSGVLSLAQAEKISAAATKASTVAVKGLGIAMKALPYVGVAAGILFIGKKLVDYASGANKAVKETKNIEEELTGTKKVLNDVANTFNGNYASSLGKTLSLYRQLQNQYRQLSSEHEKTKWIKENTDKLKELGISVKGVNDADRILINQSKDVIESFKLRAQAAAEAARLQDLYVKRIEAETEARKRANKKQIKAGEKVQAGDVDRFGLQEGIDYQQYKHTVGMFYTDAGAMKAQQALAASNIRTYTKEIDAEIEESAKRLQEAEDKYDKALGKLGVTPVGSKEPNVTKEQVTELQRLNKIIKDLEDKKENINPLDPNAADKIKELDKQIREAKSNAENFKIFIDYELDKKDYAKLQQITGEINNIKNQIDNLDKTSPDYLNQFDELNNKLKAAEKNLSDFKFEVGIEISSKTFDQLQNLSDEIDKYKKEVEDIKLNPDFSDYNNKLKEAENKLEDALKNFQDFKLKLNISDDGFDKLQELANDVEKFKQKVEDIKLHPELPDYKKQLQEAEKELNDAFKKFNDYKFELGIDVSTDDYKKLQDLYNETQKLKQNVEDIKLNPDFSDYNNKLKEAEDKLKEVSEKYQNLKVKVDFQIVNDPLKYLNALKAEQKKFEDDYKIAISVGDENAAKTAREAYQKLQKEIDKYEIEIKNLKLSDVEIEENKLKAKLDKAMEDWKLAVKNNDEAAEEAAREAVIVAQRELNEHNLKFKFEFSADGLSKAEKEINKIFDDLNKKEKKYDFSFLPEGFQDQANDVIDRLNDLTSARQKFQDIIDSNKDRALIDPEAAEAIQKAQAALASTDEEYQKLTRDAEAFNEVSSKIKERTKEFNKFTETLQAISDVTGAIDGVVNSIENMIDVFDEGASGWEKFMSIMQTAMSVMSAITTVMTIINTIKDAMNVKDAVGNTELSQEVALRGANAGAMSAEMAATTANMAVESAAIAPTLLLTQAMMKLAAANIYAAHSYIPFAGPAIASGFVATMEAIVNSIVAFAEGGVVPGSSYTGDKLLARVNSGERILTAKQNENLERIANGNISLNDGSQPSISFKIKGEDLWGTMKNYKNIHRIS